MVKVPQSILKKFSPQAIDEAFRRARAVATGRELAGERTEEGKRAFDSFSPTSEFRRAMLKGQLSRLSSGRLQAIVKRAGEKGLTPDVQVAKELQRRGQPLPSIERKTPATLPPGKLDPKILPSKIEPPSVKKPSILQRRFGLQLSRLNPVKERVKTGFDFISGGVLTKKEIEKERTKLNQDITNFNKKFGEAQLTESQFRKAKQEELILANKQKVVDQKQSDFDKSVKKKVGKFLFGDIVEGKFTEKEIKDQEKRLESINKKLANAKGVNKQFLQLQKRGTEKFLSETKAGDKKRLITGDVPLIPASIPSSTFVKFIGTQKSAGQNKVITDIVFQAGKGGKTIGGARGITAVKGDKGVTLTFGKSGRRARVLPSGRLKIIGKKSFVGLEKSVSKKAQIPISKGEIKNVGQIKKNVEGILQASKGVVIQTKRGDKFIRPGLRFPSKKIKLTTPGVDFDQFISASKSFTKKDISLITGKTITKKGDKVKFAGLIKGERSAETLSESEKLMFSKALNQVVATASASSVKATKVKGLSKGAKALIESGTLAKKSIKVSSIKKEPIKPVAKAKVQVKKPIPTKPSVKLKKKQLKAIAQKQVIKEKAKKIKKKSIKPQKIKFKPKRKGKQVISSAVRQQLQAKKRRVKKKVRSSSRVAIKSKSKVRTQTKLKTRSRLKTKQRARVVVKSKAKSRLRPRVIPKQKSKLAQKQVKKGVGAKGTTPIGRIIKPKIKLKKKKSKTKKKVRSFNVFVKPKRKRKFIKANTNPISKTRAKDLGSYLTDKSLARTYKIVPSTRKKSRLNVVVPKGYSQKTNKKFRRFRQKGKKKTRLKNTFIEKNRNLLDTRSEKRKITLAKKIASLKKVKRKRRRRRSSNDLF